MKDNILKIHQEFYIKKETSFSKIADELESEIEYLFQVKQDNYKDYEMATQMISDYGLYLFHDGYLRKAKPLIEKGIENIKNDRKVQKTGLFNDKLYIVLIWTIGQINYTLKNYKIAAEKFKTLVLEFPENDRYRNWYNGTLKYVVQKWEWASIALIIIYFFTKYIMNIESNILFFLNIIGLAGIFSTYAYRSINKIKK